MKVLNRYDVFIIRQKWHLYKGKRGFASHLLLTGSGKMRKISYGISVGRQGPVKRETGVSPVRCRRCKRKHGSLDFTVGVIKDNPMGRNQTELPRKPEDLLFPLLLSRSMT